MSVYEAGDIVQQDSFGGLRLVLVTGREADVKNGRPGFVGTALADDQPVWGYDDQLVTVWRRQAPLPRVIARGSVPHSWML